VIFVDGFACSRDGGSSHTSIRKSVTRSGAKAQLSRSRASEWSQASHDWRVAQLSHQNLAANVGANEASAAKPAHRLLALCGLDEAAAQRRHHVHRNGRRET
jgi:hypothetical protein